MTTTQTMPDSMLLKVLSGSPQGLEVARVFLNEYSKELNPFNAWEEGVKEAERQNISVTVSLALFNDVFKIGIPLLINLAALIKRILDR